MRYSLQSVSNGTEHGEKGKKNYADLAAGPPRGPADTDSILNELLLSKDLKYSCSGSVLSGPEQRRASSDILGQRGMGFIPLQRDRHHDPWPLRAPRQNPEGWLPRGAVCAVNRCAYGQARGRVRSFRLRSQAPPPNRPHPQSQRLFYSWLFGPRALRGFRSPFLVKSPLPRLPVTSRGRVTDRGVRAQEALRLLLAQGPREPSGPMGSEWVQRQACFLLTCPRPLNPPSPRGDSVQRHRRHPRPDSGLVHRQPARLWLPPSFLPGLLTPLPSSPWARTLWHQPGIDDFISDEQSQLCSHHPTLCSHQPCLPKAVPASLCLTASQTVRGCPSSTELWVLAGLSQPVLCLAGRRVWPEVVIGPPDGVKPRVTASLPVHLRGESQPRV